MGGSDYEKGDGIAVDGSGNVFITGYTYSFGAGGYDVILLKYGIDTYEDGLSDDDEVNIYGTDPNDPDTDGDLLLDGYEIGNNTLPLNPDTDGDDMPDGWEVSNSLDPLINDSSGDPDNDNLNNLEEYRNNTNPNDEDTDGDGYNDKWEIDNGTDPLDPNDPPDDGGEGTITGYEVLALIGILSLTTGIIFRKRSKELIKKNNMK